MLDPSDAFIDRHLGPRAKEIAAMLRVVGASSLETLIDEVIPEDIRRDTPIALPPAESETALLGRLREVAARNQRWRCFIGGGYYDCVTPPVIRRNLIECPGWYTPYTPYQAEVAQGRLEALLNFQTMVEELTGMAVANASLLDEATAAAEAMTMMYRLQARRRPDAHRLLVSDRCYPQTIEVVRGRAAPLGIDVAVTDLRPSAPRQDPTNCFGMLLQSPDTFGALHDPTSIVTWAHDAGLLVAVATDLLASTLVTPPGDRGADVVVGSAQRFGVPLGYGGPHAAFFAARTDYVRQIPGRIIGVSVDRDGRRAYRMALQTREQHIRRERATSNICTAQALLANVAGMYAVYHGPDGLRRIATRVHGLARLLAGRLEALGFEQRNDAFFDTIRIHHPDAARMAAVRAGAVEARINVAHHPDGDIGIALDETTTRGDVTALVAVFAKVAGSDRAGAAAVDAPLPAPQFGEALERRSPYLTHPVFTRYHSELQMMRYLKRLERKDIGLDTAMIPLGSCTMKLNAAAEMEPISWPAFSRLHPYVPPAQAAGYHEVIQELEAALCAITELDAVSLQPNSGAQGELAGLLAIRAYHEARGDGGRDVVLIPASAHGTNPASAVMAGMRVVVVACDEAGNVELDDLRRRAEAHAASLAALMITYPSTHGVFEPAIRDVCRIVHDHGGQVYLDGANLNAQVGLTSPARIGADVCHLNLHKTFAIPHGGGGPGMGPIAVARHLVPYLPRHPRGGHEGRGIAPVAAAPWGSASILLISYAYIRLLGAHGVTEATRYAILSANYLKARLEPHYPVLYTGPHGRVGHELIFDLRPFQSTAGVTAQDVAKRLMDFGFHAPTVSFPVPGTLMVEPTESEPREELDRFCDAMMAIRGEIDDIAEGRADRTDNPLKNAPHPASAVTADDWSHPYSRQLAAYPRPFVAEQKFWPAVARIDEAFGDRNLMCSCPPVEAPGDVDVVTPDRSG